MWPEPNNSMAMIVQASGIFVAGQEAEASEPIDRGTHEPPQHVVEGCPDEE